MLPGGGCEDAQYPHVPRAHGRQLHSVASIRRLPPHTAPTGPSTATAASSTAAPAISTAAPNFAAAALTSAALAADLASTFQYVVFMAQAL